MKFKNIELLEGPDSEAEIYCSVVLSNEEDADYVENSLFALLIEFPYKVNICQVTDTIILIASDNFTFNSSGVDAIGEVYDALLTAGLPIKPYVSVHIDGDICFKNEDGGERNDEDCSFDEFVQFLSY